MLRLFSLFAILAGPATALVYVGQRAFGSTGVLDPDSQLHAMFVGLPIEAAYIAPFLALTLVALGYLTLRLIGFAITVIGSGIVLAMIVAVFFKPEWIETARQMIASAS